MVEESLNEDNVQVMTGLRLCRLCWHQEMFVQLMSNILKESGTLGILKDPLMIGILEDPDMIGILEDPDMIGILGICVMSGILEDPGRFGFLKVPGMFWIRGYCGMFGIFEEVLWRSSWIMVGFGSFKRLYFVGPRYVRLESLRILVGWKFCVTGHGRMWIHVGSVE